MTSDVFANLWALAPASQAAWCPQQSSPSLLETSPGSNLALDSVSPASVRLACLGPLGWWCEGFAVPAVTLVLQTAG